MEEFVGHIRFKDDVNNGVSVWSGRNSIEECKLAIWNHICKLPENERKFHWIFIETFPSGKIVARGKYTDGKVCWNTYDQPLGFQYNYDARDYMEVTDYGRFYE